MRTQVPRIVAVSAAVALAVTLVPSGAAQAKERVCGWSGNVVPLMAKADRQVRAPRVAERIAGIFGPQARILSIKRMEVDLIAKDPSTTRPTNAATLTTNHVTYNIQVRHDGTESTASAQVRFDGLCYRTTIVVNEPWVGSKGTGKPLLVSADKALRLAQAYRRANPDAFPLSQPLVSMNLMQATTMPPDAGRLRWYVNYSDGSGGLAVLAVYMDGTVKPMG